MCYLYRRTRHISYGAIRWVDFLFVNPTGRFSAFLNGRQIYGAIREDTLCPTARCGSVESFDTDQHGVRCCPISSENIRVRCGCRDEPHGTTRENRTVDNPAIYVSGVFVEGSDACNTCFP